MGATTGISWADRTKSKWHGCAHAILDDGTKHPGCQNCYAEIGSSRNPGTLGKWGPDGTRVPSKSFDVECRKWQKLAEEQNTIFSVFPSIHDPFEVRPELDPLRLEMFEIIDECPNLLFLLLTKRPGDILSQWPGGPKFFRPNVALGASISNQKTAQELTMKLIRASAISPLLFVSAGPLLDFIDLENLDNGAGEKYNALTGEVTIERAGEDPHTFRASDTKPLGWVVVEGESTDRARPCAPALVRNLRDQCRRSKTPFHWKQWGEWLPYEMSATPPFWQSQAGDLFDGNLLPDLTDHEPVGEWYAPALDGVIYRKVGKSKAGAMLDGELIQEFPELIKGLKSCAT